MQTTTIKKSQIRVSRNIEEMAMICLDKIQESMEGSKRLRSYRWEGVTSLRDTMRMAKFVDSICSTGFVNRNTYSKLSSEIPTFHTILGQHLSRNLNKLMA